MVEAPEFIDPADITVMDDEAFDKLLTRIRESRLRAYQLYLAAEEQKMMIRDGKLRTQLSNQTRMLDKEIIRADKVVIALNKRINNIRSIQLELGDLDESI